MSKLINIVLLVIVAIAFVSYSEAGVIPQFQKFSGRSALLGYGGLGYGAGYGLGYGNYGYGGYGYGYQPGFYQPYYTSYPSYGGYYGTQSGFTSPFKSFFKQKFIG